jgi:hypothetical protein
MNPRRRREVIQNFINEQEKSRVVISPPESSQKVKTTEDQGHLIQNDASIENDVFNTEKKEDEKALWLSEVSWTDMAKLYGVFFPQKKLKKRPVVEEDLMTIDLEKLQSVLSKK